MNNTSLAPAPVAPPARNKRVKKIATYAPMPAPELENAPRDVPGPGSVISDKTLIIVAKVNVGWGNTVYLRGEGGNLSWEVGVPMICSGEDRWVWACHADEAPRSFKFLRNDEDWALGENQAMSGADITVCTPEFPG